MLHKQDEKGSALILVLGILSLVLVLGMSFVFTARTERHVAQASSDQTSAKLIAQSALNRIVSDMKYEFYNGGDPLKYPAIDNYNQSTPLPIFNFRESDTNNDFGRQLYALSKEPNIGVFSYSVSSDERQHFDEVMKLGASFYSELPHLHNLNGSTSNETFAFPITARYTINSNGTTNDCTDVIGRYGYVLLEEGSKIDVNYAMSLTGNDPFTLDNGNIYNDFNIRPTPTNSVSANYGNANNILMNYNRIASPWETKVVGYNSNESYIFQNLGTNRLGLLLEEICLDNYKSDFVNNAPQGSVGNAPWMSYAHLSNAISSFNDECFNYTFFSGEDIEAYWDTTGLTPVERSRFDLTGFTASDNTSGTCADRMNDNFWQITSQEVTNAGGLQKAAKRKINQLIDTTNYPRSEFWSSTSSHKDANGNNSVLFDEKNDRYYNDNGSLTSESTTPFPYGGIPGLALMKDDNGESISEQIAANLIDYSDSDDIATVNDNFDPNKLTGQYFEFDKGHEDNNVKDGLTYFGNERVPYINEIVLSAETNRTGTTQRSYELNFNADVELINIFPASSTSPVPKTANIKIEVRVIGKFHVAKIPWSIPENQTEPQHASQEQWTTEDYTIGGSRGYLSLTVPTTPGTVVPKIEFTELGYKKYNLTGRAFPHTSTDGETDNLEDTSVKFPQPDPVNNSANSGIDYKFWYDIHQIVVILYDDTTLDADHLCDIAFFPKKDTSPYYYECKENNVAYVPAQSSLKNILCMQVSDPRCNTFAMPNGVNWNDNYWKVDHYDGNSSLAHTLEKDNVNLVKNINPNPSTNKRDWEVGITFEGTNPKSFSTAYIRNAPMQSLWELGAIHRGMPYQTINLKKFTEPSLTDGKYENGDAAILDYVKIGPLRFVKGKINANSRNLGAIKVLFNNIPHKTYDGTNSSGVDVFDKSNIIDCIESFNSTNLMNVTTYPLSYNRGVAANLFADFLNDGTNYYVNNDRDAEALIGRNAGLLTTRLDTYTLYIVAEALREIREVNNSTQFNAIRSTLINPTIVEHHLRSGDDYQKTGNVTSYCSIMGRQSILVHLIRDAWRNDIRIARIKYLED